MTTTRKLALGALSGLRTFALARPVDREDMIVYFIVSHFGKPEHMDRLVRREQAEARELAGLTGYRIRQTFAV